MTWDEFNKAMPNSVYPSMRKSLWEEIKKEKSIVTEVLHMQWWRVSLFTNTYKKPSIWKRIKFKVYKFFNQSKLNTIREIQTEDEDETFWELVYMHQVYIGNLKNKK